MLPIRFLGRLTVTVLISLCAVSFASADEPATPEVEDSEIVAVFRISGKLFENTINRTFARDEKVDMCILDAYSMGDAHVEGKAVVDFASSKLEEPLTVEITGEIQSSSVGYTKPVVAGSRTYGTFRALVGIDFDGKEFHQVPATAHVSMRSTVDWVKARRRGLGRRLIQAVAARVAPRTTWKYDREGERLAEQQIEEGAAEGMKPILAKMNEAIKIEQTLAALAIGQSGYERSVSKTDTYLQIRVAPEGNGRVPPNDQLISDAPIEIWVYPVSERPALASALVGWQQARDFLGTVMPKPPKPPLSLEDILKITPVGDWDVIRVKARLPEINVPGVDD